MVVEKFVRYSVLVIFSFFLYLPFSCFAQSSDGLYLKVLDGVKISPKDIPIAKINFTGGLLCSGVLITRRHVLTAAHCAIDKPANYTIRIANRKYYLSAKKVFPRAHKQRAKDILKNDVAVFTLRRRVRNIKPLSFYDSAPMKQGTRIQVYGYGLDENSNYGDLRMGQTVVAAKNKYFLETKYVYPYSNSCNGDSGAPATFTFYDGKDVKTGIVGVTSWGDTTDCMEGTRSFYVDTQRKKIKAFIKKIAKNITTI